MEKQMSALNIKQAVADQIVNSNPAVLDRVVDNLAEKELTKRVQLLTDAINEYSKLESELRRFKPDAVIYDDQGVVVSSNWTKANLDARNKKQEVLNKLSGRIDKALKGDYSTLQSNGNTEKDESKTD